MIREILSRFDRSRLRIKIFLTARCLWVPYADIARLLPLRGQILDLGCGFGLMSYCLAKGSDQRSVIAIDHDDSRILQAAHAFRDCKNLKLEKGDFTILTESMSAGVVALDVLHYFSPEAQSKMISDAYRQITSGGVFIFREVNIEAGILSVLGRAYEKLMTRIGFTKASMLHFQTKRRWIEMATAAGFSVTSQEMRRFPFADILYICTKST